MRKSLLGVTVAALSLSASQPLFAQDDVDQQLGQVHFKTSCNDVAQRRFDRGMRYQHSFWYTHAKEVFEEAAKADPTCAMAYWGIALTLMDNPHNAIPRSAAPEGMRVEFSWDEAEAARAKRWGAIAQVGLLRLQYQSGQYAKVLAEYKRGQKEIPEEVRAALISRGFAEMTRFGLARGAGAHGVGGERLAPLAREQLRGRQVLRRLGGSYLDLLRFFLNHRRFLRSRHAERLGDFEREHREFAPLSCAELLAAQRISLDTGDKLRLFPHLHGTDGFYAAAFVKNSSNSG